MEKIIERYVQFYKAESYVNRNVQEPQKHVTSTSFSRTISELLEIAKRSVYELILTEVSVNEVEQIEEVLFEVLQRMRTRKKQLTVDMISKLHEQESMLLKEKGRLELMVTSMENALEARCDNQNMKLGEYVMDDTQFPGLQDSHLPLGHAINPLSSYQMATLACPLYSFNNSTHIENDILGGPLILEDFNQCFDLDPE